MRLRSFFVSVLLFAGSPAIANEYLAAEHLKSAVESYLQSEIERRHFGSAQSGPYRSKSVLPPPKITASNIDPRLKLKKCSEELGMSLLSQTGISKNVSVKVQCAKPNRWAVYVPATIEVYSYVAILNQPLRRGAIITSDHVSSEIRDITTIGDAYLADTSQALGMQLKRNMNVGQVLRLSHLKPARIINKGDKVVVEAAVGALSVVTAAKALSHGAFGEQIQVQNIRSNRVIDAKIVGPGRVQVLL